MPAFNAQFTFEVDSDNNIIGLYRDWREYQPAAKVELITPSEAIRKFPVQGSKNTITASQREVNATDISLGYLPQISENGQEYLEPVYLVGGKRTQ